MSISSVSSSSYGCPRTPSTPQHAAPPALASSSYDTPCPPPLQSPNSLRLYAQSLSASMSKGFYKALQDLDESPVRPGRARATSCYDAEVGFFDEDPIDRHVRDQQRRQEKAARASFEWQQRPPLTATPLGTDAYDNDFCMASRPVTPIATAPDSPTPQRRATTGDLMPSRQLPRRPPMPWGRRSSMFAPEQVNTPDSSYSDSSFEAVTSDNYYSMYGQDRPAYSRAASTLDIVSDMDVDDVGGLDSGPAEVVREVRVAINYEGDYFSQGMRPVSTASTASAISSRTITATTAKPVLHASLGGSAMPRPVPEAGGPGRAPRPVFTRLRSRPHPYETTVRERDPSGSAAAAAAAAANAASEDDLTGAERWRPDRPDAMSRTRSEALIEHVGLLAQRGRRNGVQR